MRWYSSYETKSPQHVCIAPYIIHSSIWPMKQTSHWLIIRLSGQSGCGRQKRSCKEILFCFFSPCFLSFIYFGSSNQMLWFSQSLSSPAFPISQIKAEQLLMGPAFVGGTPPTENLPANHTQYMKSCSERSWKSNVYLQEKLTPQVCLSEMIKEALWVGWLS